MFFLWIMSKHIPPVSNFCYISLPKLNGDDGPDAHKDSKEDCGLIIKEVFKLEGEAALPKLCDLAEIVTNWTHGDIGHHSTADVIRGNIRRQCEDSKEEAKEANNAGRDEHEGVVAKPSEVQSNLDTKVVSDGIQWLLFPELL